MTVQILKSRLASIGRGFEIELADYIKALEEHRFSGDAAPHSYPEVEAAVRRVQHSVEDGKPDDFVVDYEIVNDDPPPAAPPTLQEKKSAALAELRRQEQLEINALIPPETRRLADRKYRLAFAAEPKSTEDLAVIAERQALERKLDEIDERYAKAEAALAEMQ